MASIKWTPPAGWVEETGAHVLMLTPCDGTATSTLTIGANSYTIVDGMGASFSMRAGVFAAGALLEFVLDVNAKKAYLLSQAGLSAAPQKPKLLWWGVFSNGSITVDGLSDYTHFLIQMNGALLLGTVSSGIISLGTFQCDSSAAGWATLMTANVSVNGDTLTMNHTFYVSVNNTNWYQSAADTYVQINGIWGLYKAEDIQEETA